MRHKTNRLNLGARRKAEKSGRRAEFIAVLWLNLKCYRILGRLVRTPVGELDIVAMSPRGVLTIIEVKARRSRSEALEAISYRQRERISRAAKLYLGRRPALRHSQVLFDAILIVPYRVPRHLKDAWRPC
jgi:putative endonuclease